MNQYRCDNGCKYFEQHYCNFLHDRLANIEIVHIERVGCASHSDFQSERDKVLDEFKNWVIHDMVFCDSIGADHMFSHECILDKIAELRQAGEP